MSAAKKIGKMIEKFTATANPSKDGNVTLSGGEISGNKSVDGSDLVTDDTKSTQPV